MYFLWLVRVKSFRKRKKAAAKRSKKQKGTATADLPDGNVVSRSTTCRRLSSVVEEEDGGVELGVATTTKSPADDDSSHDQMCQWANMRKWSVPVSPESNESYSAVRKITPRSAATNPEFLQRYRQSSGSSSNSSSGVEPEMNSVREESHLSQTFAEMTVSNS